MVLTERWPCGRRCLRTISAVNGHRVTMAEVERCDAAELAAVLVQASEPGSKLLLAKPLSAATPCIAWVTTSSLWKLSLWREPGVGLAMTLDGWSPDGRYWERGCQRRWVEDGEVIDPLDQLTAEQRDALDARLMRANCWPHGEYSPMPDYVS